VNYRSIEQCFIRSAIEAGSVVFDAGSIDSAVLYIHGRIHGDCILPVFESSVRAGLPALLENRGIRLITDNFRRQGPDAEGGITGASFAIAETGTIVIESTSEPIVLASSLPEKHFVLLDRRKIVEGPVGAIPILRKINRKRPKDYIAYITGPSRTADIERVLTIGVHGPAELHIIILDNFSSDLMES
jgi:L-lactate dehydrogenase complex protein LldG